MRKSLVIAFSLLAAGCGMFENPDDIRIAKTVEATANRCPVCGRLPVVERTAVPVTSVRSHGTTTPEDLDYLPGGNGEAYVYDIKCLTRGCRVYNLGGRRYWHLDEAISAWNRNSENTRRAKSFK